MKIAITPVPAIRMTRADRWKQRPGVLRYFAFRDELKLKWGNQILPERIRLIFVMPMPKSWSEKKRLELDGKPHQQKPDIDNLQKSIQDALAIEDSYIWDAHCTKYWGRDGSITIEELNE